MKHSSKRVLRHPSPPVLRALCESCLDVIFSQGTLSPLTPALSPRSTERRGRRGFTLVELLVVMAMLMFFMGLVVTLLWGAIRIERAGAALMQRTIEQATLADQFRSDVAQATKAPQGVDQFQASPVCLILQQQHDTHVVYHWDRNHLRRWLIVGEIKTERPVPIGALPDDVNLELTRAGNLCSLRLRAAPPKDGARPRFQLEFTAALGGERR